MTELHQLHGEGYDSEPRSHLNACGPISAPPLHILIVEDDPNMALVISRTVGQIRTWFPHAVITRAGTWADASRLLNAEPAPVATFLDLGLPDSTMHETIARVDEIEARSAVVIITGTHRETVEELLVNKEVEILEKGPGLFVGDTLIRAAVRAILRRGRIRQEESFQAIDADIAQLRAHLLKEKWHAPPAQ